MKLAIMQPYFFPYIGYFQLIHVVDAFVFYDDVNYIKSGWINRNNILSNGKSELITLETFGASSNKRINEVGVGRNGKKLLKNIEQKYSRAPYFERVFPLVERVIHSDEHNLAKYIENSLRLICEYLALERHWYTSSDLKKDIGLKGQEKVLAICDELHATHYINLPGGIKLYERSLFMKRGIDLSFLQSRCKEYAQFDKTFVPYLSIIDVLMFNDQERCSDLIQEYSLV